MSSPIDDIYFEIFGTTPAKAGSAFERLSAIMFFILEDSEVTHDSRLRGEFSNSLYQLDVLQKSKLDERVKMAEAKDYSHSGKKVGRADLQKLAGALPDLPAVEEGAFVSATGYTGPARKYSRAAASMPGGKPISLFTLSPSTEEDERGRVKTVVVRLHVSLPQLDRAKWIPRLTSRANELLQQSLSDSGEDALHTTVLIDEFFDSNGNRISSLEDVTAGGYGDIDDAGASASACACFVLPGHYVYLLGVLTELHGLEYTIPFVTSHYQFRWALEGQARLTVRDGSGVVLRLLTDAEIRQFEFDADGRVIRR